MKIKPAEHMSIHRKFGVLGILHFVGLVGLFETTVQPWSDQQLLSSQRAWSAAVLPANVAVDRADAHEVVPASNGKAGDIHLVVKTSAVFIGPVAVVGRMPKPLGQ